MTVVTVEEAIEDFKRGKFLIITDDANRENEGDLAIAADFVTPESVNFMAKHARGLLCTPLAVDFLDRLNIPLMTQTHAAAMHGTAFTVSIDYLQGTTTGISAFDRSATVKAAIDPASKPSDFAQPGHTFPLRYREGGVLARAGHTEASVDLSILAGLKPASVICEIMNDDGTMARMGDLETFSKIHNINIVSIEQLISYRRRTEQLAEKTGTAKLPTRYGDFTIHGFVERYDAEEHVALVMGDWKPEEPVMVRVHSQCFTGDIFGSLRCDCGSQVEQSLKAIASEGKGVFLYMRQEGRGIGLHNKIRAYQLQDTGLDTVEANAKLGFEPDLRNYGIGAQILSDLGVKKIRLLTNNPQKIVGLSGFDLEVVERIPMLVEVTNENIGYLRAKKQKLGHLIDPTDDSTTSC
ncbi:bifunctional 3,4-dihydroxy-2-butanone-4-phosphate synthase/GTP cyclohydrolase II [SAR202 cluster bacterium AD-804-J14_MRT_500m]|nr:bifunctional 3,4-dihydroxy-2-butanone-4-phosphate synthase/GTP cyclohydrolase II [SAR202 cluster bacterium AD-804-J14_MRT_500m]